MALWANGNMVAYEPDMQPKLNGAGREVVPMSDEQKCELHPGALPSAAPAPAPRSSIALAKCRCSVRS